jgi:predicted dehydrogenase
MKTFGVAVLGYGYMGKVHAFAHKTIPFYYDPPPARCALKVVCSSTPERGAAAQAHGGFERWTTSLDDAINAPDVDLVHICTPNHLHLPALTAAIRAGKHVYVEKPLTATLAEAEQLEKLLPGYRGVGQVVLNYRCYPSTLRAKQLVSEGFLGPITHFRAQYLHSGSVDVSKPAKWRFTADAGGGVILDLGVHALDMLTWLIGPISELTCVSRVWAERRPSAADPGRDVAVEVEDAAAMLVRQKDGAFGVVECSKLATGAEDEFRVEIHGRDGALRLNLANPSYLEIYDARQAAANRGWQQLATLHRYPAPGGTFPDPRASVGWIQSHIHCLYTFLRSVADGTPPEASLAKGIELQRLLEAARRSAKGVGRR